MTKTKIACVQMDCLIGQVETNRRKIVERIRNAAEAGAEMVIFPECALTGYSFDSLEEAGPFAEPLDGPSVEAIAEACMQANVYAVVGFIEKGETGLFNAAMLIAPDGPVGSYRKVHLPYLGVDRFLTPGDSPFAVFDLRVGKVGINICYDASFPEAARSLKLLGAQLILLPTNWPTDAWRTPEFVINTRAMENHINFASINRVGVERGWRFIGKSKVVDYNGDTVAEAESGEEILYAHLDLQESDNNRIVNAPGSYEIDRLADRRPQFYDSITAATQALRESATGDNHKSQMVSHSSTSET